MFLVGCMWLGYINDDSIALSEQEREELTMEDVVQMYLDAGFPEDGTWANQSFVYDKC